MNRASIAPNETNPLPANFHEEVTANIKRTVYWTEPGLKILRLRLLSDPGFPAWDVSYCVGEIDGEYVRVSLPFFQLPKGKLSQAIVEYAKADKLYAKATGIFDVISTLC